MLTESELVEAERRLDKIRTARHRLEAARKKLALFNKHGAGKTWKVPIILKKSDSVYDRHIEMDAVIPAGVIQQQLVYAVGAAKRELVMLGGQENSNG